MARHDPDRVCARSKPPEGLSSSTFRVKADALAVPTSVVVAHHVVVTVTSRTLKLGQGKLKTSLLDPSRPAPGPAGKLRADAQPAVCTTS
jgi:hypothetical protein